MDLSPAPRAFVGYRDLLEQVAGLRHKHLRTVILVHRHLIYHLVLLLHSQVDSETDIKDCFSCAILLILSNISCAGCSYNSVWTHK